MYIQDATGKIYFFPHGATLTMQLLNDQGKIIHTSTVTAINNSSGKVGYSSTGKARLAPETGDFQESCNFTLGNSGDVSKKSPQPKASAMPVAIPLHELPIGAKVQTPAGIRYYNSKSKSLVANQPVPEVSAE